MYKPHLSACPFAIGEELHIKFILKVFLDCFQSVFHEAVVITGTKYFYSRGSSF